MYVTTTSTTTAAIATNYLYTSTSAFTDVIVVAKEQVFVLFLF